MNEHFWCAYAACEADSASHARMQQQKHRRDCTTGSNSCIPIKNHEKQKHLALYRRGVGKTVKIFSLGFRNFKLSGFFGFHFSQTFLVWCTKVVLRLYSLLSDQWQVDFLAEGGFTRPRQICGRCRVKREVNLPVCLSCLQGHCHAPVV